MLAEALAGLATIAEQRREQARARVLADIERRKAMANGSITLTHCKQCNRYHLENQCGERRQLEEKV